MDAKEYPGSVPVISNRFLSFTNHAAAAWFFSLGMKKLLQNSMLPQQPWYRPDTCYCLFSTIVVLPSVRVSLSPSSVKSASKSPMVMKLSTLRSWPINNLRPDAEFYCLSLLFWNQEIWKGNKTGGISQNYCTREKSCNGKSNKITVITTNYCQNKQIKKSWLACLCFKAINFKYNRDFIASSNFLGLKKQ